MTIRKELSEMSLEELGLPISFQEAIYSLRRNRCFQKIPDEKSYAKSNEVFYNCT